MKHLFVILTAIALTSLGSLGCDKKTDAPATGSEGANSKDQKPAVLMDDDLPVKGDFVDEAESSITKENYKGELDKLATEIEKE